VYFENGLSHRKLKKSGGVLQPSESRVETQKSSRKLKLVLYFPGKIKKYFFENFKPRKK